MQARMPDADRPRHARGGQVGPQRRRRGARGGRFPALLRDGGGEHRSGHAGARRHRVHQPVELPAGDLHGPGRGGAGRRQPGARQAGRGNAADRRRSRGAPARSRRSARRAATGARRRAHRRGAGRLAVETCRRDVHRLDRGGAHHCPHACQAPVTQRPPDPADRRDRRAERDDRRFLGAGRAGGGRCHRLGLRQRRPALLGAARAVPAGRCRRPDAGHAEGRAARNCRWPAPTGSASTSGR